MRVVVFASSHVDPCSGCLCSGVRCAGALYTYIKVEYEEKYPDTDVPDIQSLIASKLRGGFTLDYEDFKSVSPRTHAAVS
jgi:hypothetical protein